MARNKVSRGQPQCDSRQHDRSECGQTKKVLGTLQRGADFRTRIAHILQLLGQGQPPLQPCTQTGHLRRIPRKQQAVADAAAFLHQSAGGKVCDIHCHARRKAGEADSLIDIAHHLRCNAQAQRTDINLIAELQSHAPHQARVRPQRAARGYVLYHVLRAVINLDFAAQRITNFHRLYFCQLTPALGNSLLRINNHTGESRSFEHLQAALPGGIPIGLRQRPPRSHAEVSAQQAGRFLL